MNISIILFLFLFVTPIFGVRPEKQGKSQQNFDRSTTGTSNQYDTGSGSTTGGTSTGGMIPWENLSYNIMAIRQPQFWPNMQHQQDQPLPQNLQDHEENIENKEGKTWSKIGITLMD
uniref:Uncharacterized protein n=1 Tax=Meloidogyne hapla TaxID=6305 RepID=A0A1I8C1R0_MELHA